MTGQSFALVLPFANKEMMNLYLAEFAKTIADDVHVVMVLDGAGWHGKAALNVPDNITLVSLPAYSPELNPVERLWLYLKETCLSLRVFADQAAIIDACCQAWNRATEDIERIISLCNYPWIKAVSS
ncbi:Transposase [Consotaella salsifontis]|uniref:Transposase n=1 Tax=Consotaella salsifontis TaxID=1365950 RepID=A0A1T4TA39_9HYPH|nr:Transposase [Consotaella salsifontis]